MHQLVSVVFHCIPVSSQSGISLPSREPFAVEVVSVSEVSLQDAWFRISLGGRVCETTML